MNNKNYVLNLKKYTLVFKSLDLIFSDFILEYGAKRPEQHD